MTKMEEISVTELTLGHPTMCRFHLPAIRLAALVAVLAAGYWAAAQAVSSKTAKRAPEAADEEERPQLSLPGFWALALPPVQKELWLTETQREKLQAIGARYQAKAQAAMEGLQRLGPEEQKRRLESLREQARKDVKAVHAQVADVLTPQQLQSYEKLAFRLRVPAVLEDSHLLGSLKLTDWQKTKLGQIRDNLEERLHRVQVEAADKTLDILTASQQDKLKEEFNQEGL